MPQNNYIPTTNNNKVNRKLIFLKENVNSKKEEKHKYNLHTERNNEKNLQKKKKLFFITLKKYYFANNIKIVI